MIARSSTLHRRRTWVWLLILMIAPAIAAADFSETKTFSFGAPDPETALARYKEFERHSLEASRKVMETFVVRLRLQAWLRHCDRKGFSEALKVDTGAMLEVVDEYIRANPGAYRYRMALIAATRTSMALYAWGAAGSAEYFLRSMDPGEKNFVCDALEFLANAELEQPGSAALEGRAPEE